MNLIGIKTVGVKRALSGLIQFSTTESPLKMIKNTFYFTSKALFVLKIFKFCLDFLVFYENGLTRKKRLILKFMTSQTGKQTIVIHVLPKILRNNDNQAIKFGQLREYNMKNIFLKKSYRKCGGETSPRPFSEKPKLSISLDQQSEFLFSSFYCISKWMTTTLH